MAKKGDNRKGADKGSIVIKREEIVEGGHHGGAWKVAYADFVTAMMAFFLLMWLLNATTEAQRRGLADYFSPSNVMAVTSSGSGKPFGGETPFSDGQMQSTTGATQVIPGFAQPQPDVDEDDTMTTAATRLAAGDGTQDDTSDSATSNGAPTQTKGPVQPTAAQLAAAQAAAEKKAFAAAAAEIKQAIDSDPSLGELGKQLSVDMTNEGLRIQIMDGDKQEMFPTGSSDLDNSAKLLLAKIGPVLAKLSEPISISGYTDARPYTSGTMTNWELSADRANATRRFLEQNGLAPERVDTVTGHADRNLLLPDQPLAPANRRIAIVVMRQAGKDSGPQSLLSAAAGGKS